jgi:hypothetical protein
MHKVQKGQILVYPWYEREDFEQLRHMTSDETLPATYDEWLAQMERAAKEMSEQGYPVMSVRVRVSEYFGWLHSQCRPDTAAARSTYVQSLAVELQRELTPHGETTTKQRGAFPTRH